MRAMWAVAVVAGAAEAGSAQASMGPGVGYCSHAPASRAPGLSLNHTRRPAQHSDAALGGRLQSTARTVLPLAEVGNAKTQSN